MPTHHLVTKAVITAAGRGTRLFPATRILRKELFPLVAPDGYCKPALQLVVEEALSAGIEQICVVVPPGGELLLREHFRAPSPEEREALATRPGYAEQAEKLGQLAERVSYVLQPEPRGYGHAVYCAREYVGRQPFLLLLGDHVYLSREERSCARQLVETFMRSGVTVSGVQRTPAADLSRFGTVAGAPLPGREGLCQVRAIREKPTLEYAERELRTPGLPENTYLCFFGMHVFTPGLFACLEEQLAAGRREGGEVQLTCAQEALRERERYLALELAGSRHDLGVPEGLVETQTALALRSPYRTAVYQATREAEEEPCT